MKPLEFFKSLENFLDQRYSSLLVEMKRFLDESDSKAVEIQSRGNDIQKEVDNIKSLVLHYAPDQDNLLAARDYLKCKLDELTKEKRNLDVCLSQKEIDYKVTSDRVKKLKDQLHDLDDRKEELSHALNEPELPLTLKLMKSSKIHQQ